MAVLDAAAAALAMHLRVTYDVGAHEARCICGWTGTEDEILRHVAAQVLAAAFRTSNPGEVREAVSDTPPPAPTFLPAVWDQTGDGLSDDTPVVPEDPSPATPIHQFTAALSGMVGGPAAAVIGEVPNSRQRVNLRCGCPGRIHHAGDVCPAPLVSWDDSNLFIREHLSNFVGDMSITIGPETDTPIVPEDPPTG